MRVLHVDLGRELRGGQYQVLLLLRVLREACCESVLMARPGSPLFEKARELGFQTVSASAWRLTSLSAQFDLVHAHDARAHSLAAIASRNPFVVARRVAFPVSRSLLSKIKYARAARFLAVSEFVAGELKAAGVPGSKIDVVYDAVELRPEVNHPEMKKWSAAAPVVALDVYDPQKGRDLIERASALAGIPITFSTNLERDLLHASAFVYISRSEGLGSGALLAMVMGVPLIANRVGGLAEVFDDGISGLAVEAEPAAIASAMQRVLASPGLAAALIQNAALRVGSRFNTTVLLQRTLASYQRALDG